MQLLIICHLRSTEGPFKALNPGLKKLWKENRMTRNRFPLWRLKSLLIHSWDRWRFSAFIRVNLQKDLMFIIPLKTKKKGSAVLSDCTPINAKKWTKFSPEIFARRLD